MLTGQRGPLTLAGPKGSARLKIGPAGYTGYSAGPLFVIHQIPTIVRWQQRAIALRPPSMRNLASIIAPVITPLVHDDL